MKPGVKVFKNGHGEEKYQPIVRLDDRTVLGYMKISWPMVPMEHFTYEWVQEGVNPSTAAQVYGPNLYVHSKRAMNKSKDYIKQMNKKEVEVAKNDFKLVDRIWEDE